MNYFTMNYDKYWLISILVIVSLILVLPLAILIQLVLGVIINYTKRVIICSGIILFTIGFFVIFIKLGNKYSIDSPIFNKDSKFLKSRKFKIPKIG